MSSPAFARIIVLLIATGGLVTLAQGHGSDASDPPAGEGADAFTLGSDIVLVLHHNGTGIATATRGLARFNETFDITVTAIDQGFVDREGPTDVLLVAPSGATVAEQAPLDDMEHCGRAGDYSGPCSHPTRFANLTYPAIRFTEAGVWSLRSNGSIVGRFVVAPATLQVALSSSHVEASTSATFGLVVTVTTSYGARAVGARVTAPGMWGGELTTNSQGQVGILQSGTPPAGHYEVRAARDVAGSADADEAGEAPFDVTPAVPRARVAVTSAHVPAGTDAHVDVDISGEQDLGTLTLVLTYDPHQARIEDVTVGDVSNATFSWADENGSVRIVLATSDVPGPSTALTLAHLTLHALRGGDSVLHVVIEEAAHSDGSPQATTTSDGMLQAWIPGDVNGDGVVDLGDAQAIADAIVGHAPTTYHAENADANGDGLVTGIDVMLTRQLAAHTRELAD